MSGYSQEVWRDPNYQKQKREFKRKYPYCKICHRYTSHSHRTLDHIVPMWQYEGSPADQRNWQMICDRCHAKKTREEGHPVIG